MYHITKIRYKRVGVLLGLIGVSKEGNVLPIGNPCLWF